MLLPGRDVCNVFVAGVFLLLLACRFISGVESDINCLKSFICNFLGVECWHPHDESKVLNIKLADLGLKGQFPRGVVNCTSLTGLDLSRNNLSGPIPEDIHQLISYITSFDLSSNSFSGTIPRNISDCTHLNVLKLDNNKLTGQIPQELAQLSRLKIFSVANNQLSGPVPNFNSGTTGVFSSNTGTIGVESCANNHGLCGAPLESCRSSSQNKWSKDLVRAIKSHAELMFGALGFVFSFFLFPFSIESFGLR
ncbi:hypothetical protein ACLB2K_013675 [Fragaria x ananassa]